MPEVGFEPGPVVKRRPLVIRNGIDGESVSPSGMLYATKPAQSEAHQSTSTATVSSAKSLHSTFRPDQLLESFSQRLARTFLRSAEGELSKEVRGLGKPKQSHLYGFGFASKMVQQPLRSDTNQSIENNRSFVRSHVKIT